MRIGNVSKPPIRARMKTWKQNHPKVTKGLNFAGKTVGAAATTFAIWIAPRVAFQITEYPDLDYTEPGSIHIGLLTEALPVGLALWFGKMTQRTKGAIAVLFPLDMNPLHVFFWTYPLCSLVAAIRGAIRGAIQGREGEVKK